MESFGDQDSLDRRVLLSLLVASSASHCFHFADDASFLRTLLPSQVFCNMPTAIGINGFGRIGRLVMRAALDNPNGEWSNVCLLAMFSCIRHLPYLGKETRVGADDPLWRRVRFAAGPFLVGDKTLPES